MQWVQTSHTLRNAEETTSLTRIKLSPGFDPYWLVKGFTAFAPLRFTTRLTLKGERWVQKKNISCVNYQHGSTASAYIISMASSPTHASKALSFAGPYTFSRRAATLALPVTFRYVCSPGRPRLLRSVK